ncbi:hypothetical protein KXW71_009226 [Aspergillus fumigatus]|nr:hypothetical protein KXW71_009226 [Aspergillus fumigatus]KAH3129555.1 hypothetical protein KXV82_002055 [Aspergillus fumigatus]KAH3422258.1 hypothetical protein KXW09_000410 [Aspergillus fumigatus]
MVNPQIKLMLTIEKQSSRTMAKAFTFIVIFCASLISIVYAQAACNPPVTALPILLVKWSKGSSHISSALVVSPAATESAGFYMSTQQIAELVVEFVQLAPSAVVCAAGQSCCNGVCTTLTTTTHCGACGTTCPAGQGCCNGACTALNTATNCGACGRAPLVYHLAMVFVALSKTSPAAVDNAPAFQALLRAVGHVAMPALDLMMNAVVEYALLAIRLLIAEPVAMLWVDHKPPAKCGVNEECCLGVCTAVDTPAACGDCTTVVSHPHQDYTITKTYNPKP